LLCVDGTGEMVANSRKWLLICATLAACRAPNTAYQRGTTDGPRATDASPDARDPDRPAPDGSEPPEPGLLADAASDATAIVPDMAADLPPDLAVDLPPADVSPDGPGTALPTPVAYWRLDTSPGNTTPDDRSQNPGTLSNGAALIPGGAPLMFPGPSCANLDGSNDYLSLGTRGLPGLNQVKSVSLWFWSNQSANVFRENIISIENRSAGQSIHLGLEQGAVALWRWTSADASANASGRVTVQRWYHLGYTFDGQTHRLYVDGTMVDSAAYTLDGVSVAELYLGTHHPTQLPDEWFRGRLDDVRIYDRALTASQITTLAAGRW
jgi:Concanavalin A-like lectin/glucanases superfamily